MDVFGDRLFFKIASQQLFNNCAFTPLTIAKIFRELFQMFNPAATAPPLVFSQRIITSPLASIWC